LGLFIHTSQANVDRSPPEINSIPKQGLELISGGEAKYKEVGIRTQIYTVYCRNYEPYWYNEWPITGTIEAKKIFLAVMISNS